MKPEYSIIKKAAIVCALFFIVFSIPAKDSDAAAIAPAEMTDYCIVPPFVGQSIPPLVMFVMGKDHKLYYEAYNDVFDYNGDGTLDITYNHAVEYYGYFDPYKCYEYNTSGTDSFSPVDDAQLKFCSAGEWSGNFMNWLTMSRMDVLRKVIYGGYRGPNNVHDSSAAGDKATLLQRAFIPQDAHSWGKEFTGKLCYDGSEYTNQCLSDLDCESGDICVDKSLELIGMAGPSSITSCRADPVDQYCSTSFLACSTDADCSPSEACVYSRTGRILVARYDHDSAKTCSPMDHTNMMSSIEPQNYFTHNYVTNFNHRTLRPDRDHGRNDFNIVATTDFEVLAGEDLNWQFMVDGDDAVEVEIDGFVEATYYQGCNTGPVQPCFGDPNTDAVCDPAQESIQTNLTPGWHRMVVRHFDEGGNDGAKVWYKNNVTPNWTIFGSRTLNLRAPDVVSGNECSLKDQSFVETGDPFVGSIITGGTANRHLFCNTSLGDKDSDPPMLRMLLDRSERIWTWASKEGQACDDSLGSPDDEYEVRVAVCVPGFEEDNCIAYKNSPPNKPAGLMQKYGLNDDEQVCSKSFSPCQTSNDCVAPEECVNRAQMFFGLMTGSYDKNMSGGLLRLNIDHVAHDVNNAQVGQLKDKGIIETLNNMKMENRRAAG
jgi:type IV pilus assembly protein PilY1